MIRSRTYIYIYIYILIKRRGRTYNRQKFNVTNILKKTKHERNHQNRWKINALSEGI